MKAVLALCLAALPAFAQTPNGRAAVYTCEAQQSCGDGGLCAQTDARLFVIETFVTGSEPGPTFFAGPQAPDARAGLFFEHPLHALHGARAPEDWFLRLPVILGTHLFARLPDAEANRYILIQPAGELPEIEGDRVVTEFLCTQALFP